MSDTITVHINSLALMTTREKIAVYLGMHPEATVRAIQVACGISSPSVVQYHLERLETPRTICCPTCQGKGRIRPVVGQFEISHKTSKIRIDLFA